jgi:hypothetical protein
VARGSSVEEKKRAWKPLRSRVEIAGYRDM